ncbi:MAG: YraN family protein [Candidatus Aureabacteria bacterium]|nr:YraN family protein [Candidatus Auribacterota bacterium]
MRDLSAHRGQLGRQGEKLAERFLRGQGYRILARNYRCSCGEIDLIARDGETVAFIEVKGKSTGRFGSPLEAVTARKRQRLVLVANHYLTACALHHMHTRFDVVGVCWTTGAAPSVMLVKDAFRVSG